MEIAVGGKPFARLVDKVNDLSPDELIDIVNHHHRRID